MFSIEWQDLLTALALAFVLEGLIPFAKPKSARRYFATLAGLPNNKVRQMGGLAMIIGLVLLAVSK